MSAAREKELHLIPRFLKEDSVKAPMHLKGILKPPVNAPSSAYVDYPAAPLFGVLSLGLTQTKAVETIVFDRRCNL